MWWGWGGWWICRSFKEGFLINIYWWKIGMEIGTPKISIKISTLKIESKIGMPKFSTKIGIEIVMEISVEI